jgi:hypothetical protein
MANLQESDYHDGQAERRSGRPCPRYFVLCAPARNLRLPATAGTRQPRAPVVALSLGGLRRKIEIALLPDDVIVVLSLDRAARVERDRRRLSGRPRPGFAGTSG